MRMHSLSEVGTGLKDRPEGTQSVVKHFLCALNDQSVEQGSGPYVGGSAIVGHIQPALANWPYRK